MRTRVLGLLRNRKIIASILLVAIIVTAVTFTISSKPADSTTDFYLGVEVAYGNFDDLKALVSEVKNYTNLVVLGLPEVSINRTLLDQSCDYIYQSDLHFIVLFTKLSQYQNWTDSTPAQWVTSAKEKYGDKFLAVYRWDEAGGDQLDRSKYQEVLNASNYADAAQKYTAVLNPEIKYYQNAGQNVLTADYGLYWFDYQAGYDTVLAEFGWNNSREQQIASVRGAARTFDRDWGAMITWDYTNYSGSPFLESGTEMYNDLLLAYNQGAKYAVIFNYPKIDSAQYGTLRTEHLTALKQFWDYSQTHGRLDDQYKNTKVAYVMPENYGFGFRSATDTIWGLWSADSQTASIYNDVHGLIRQHGANFDIIHDNATLLADVGHRYETLIFWNGTTITP
jgi:hypothetical protein